MIINKNGPSLTVIYGPPGGGKTTLAMQCCALYSNALFISTEQKKEMMKQVAVRVNAAGVLVVDARHSEEIAKYIEKQESDLVVVDSLQGIRPELGYLSSSKMGAHNELIDYLYEYAWSMEKKVIVINHETKTEWMRGSRYIEHIGDIVIRLAGNGVINVMKSRFEKTPIKIEMEMTPSGLKEKPGNIRLPL